MQGVCVVGVGSEEGLVDSRRLIEQASLMITERRFQVVSHAGGPICSERDAKAALMIKPKLCRDAGVGVGETGPEGCRLAHGQHEINAWSRSCYSILGPWCR